MSYQRALLRRVKRTCTLTGSFCGPQAALLFSWSKPGTLILFTVMAATAGGLCFRLPDTKDVPTPSTAQQVRNMIILTFRLSISRETKSIKCVQLFN